MFIILSSAPWCRCWHLFHTTASLSDPADKFKASFFFFFCISVVSWTVIYCVSLWTKRFSVKLKPKGVIFFLSSLLSRFFVLHWLKISVVCCLLIPIFIAGIICLLFQHDTWLSVLVVCLWNPHKPEWYRQEVCGWILLLFSLFFLLLLSCFLFSQWGVECAIPHTAIYAGQELWHFIFCLWDL